MAGATAPKLGAGSVMSYEADPQGSPDVYSELSNLLTVPDIGEQGSFVQVTPIKNTVHEYIAGMKDADDIELVFNDVPGDPVQEAFLALADASGDPVKMELVLPSGKTGNFSLSLNGHRMNAPSHGNALTVTVYARKSGAVTWTIV